MRTRTQAKAENTSNSYENSKKVECNHSKRNSPSRDKSKEHQKMSNEEQKHKQMIDSCDSRVFKRQKHTEGRERELDNTQEVGDTSEGADEADDKDESFNCEKEKEENNMQIATVEEAPRVTIKDIINSHKSDTRKRKRTPKVETPKVEDPVVATELTEVAKPAQLRKRIIIVDGKPQIDQSSMMIEESHFRKAENDPKNYKVINDDEYNNSNSLIYAKRSHTKKWTPEETEFFYKCLEECGTDFSMIESRFNGTRNRTQIKNKFRKEENENPQRIDQVVLSGAYKGESKKRDDKASEKESESFES